MEQAITVKKEPAKAATLPTGVIMDRETGDTKKASAALVRLVMQGWQRKVEIDALKGELADINGEIIKKVGVGNTVQIFGLCRAGVSRRQRVSVIDAERLKKILGPRYEDLVREAVRYEPEKKLLRIACDGDDPLQGPVGECLQVSESESVTWRAEK